MKKFFSLLVAALLLISMVSVASVASGNLVLYTSAGATEYELIVNLFNQKYPDIAVEIVTGGTGEIASRINAEKAAPYGDVMMGGGETSFRGIEEENVGRKVHILNKCRSLVAHTKKSTLGKAAARRGCSKRCNMLACHLISFMSAAK